MAFSQETFDLICIRIAEGESLRKICLDDDMPSKTSVMRWLVDNEGIRDQYARAREQQADTLFEECLDIADETGRDIVVVDGVERPNNEVINRSRLRIDTRKWMAGKLRPKKYGDKLDVDMKAAFSVVIDKDDADL